MLVRGVDSPTPYGIILSRIMEMGRWSGQTQVLAIFMPTMCDTVSHSGMGPQVVGEHDNNCPHLAWLYSYIQLHLLLEELLNNAFEPCTSAFETRTVLDASNA